MLAEGEGKMNTETAILIANVLIRIGKWLKRKAKKRKKK